MKTLLLAFGLATAAATVTPAVAGATETLRIFNWADYFGETTLADFTAATGVATSLDLYDSNEVLETRLLTGGSGFDLVFPALSNAEREGAAGALLPVDPARLKNYGNLDPAILAVLDRVPGGRSLGVPYTWGTIGLAYDKAKMKQILGTADIDSLSVLFDPAVAGKLKACGITVIDSPLEMTAIALNYLGLDPYSERPEDLEKAGSLLTGMAASVKDFHNQRATAELADGSTCLALIYSGDALTARARAVDAGQGIEIGYAIPKEGTMMWVDLMAIPADAASPDLAYRFMDFMLEPASMADVTATVGFATANPQARTLLDPELANDPGLYPPAETLSRLFPDRSVAAKLLRDRTRLWTRVKTGN